MNRDIYFSYNNEIYVERLYGYLPHSIRDGRKKDDVLNELFEIFVNEDTEDFKLYEYVGDAVVNLCILYEIYQITGYVEHEDFFKSNSFFYCLNQVNKYCKRTNVTVKSCADIFEALHGYIFLRLIELNSDVPKAIMEIKDILNKRIYGLKNVLLYFFSTSESSKDYICPLLLKFKDKTIKEQHNIPINSVLGTEGFNKRIVDMIIIKNLMGSRSMDEKIKIIKKQIELYFNTKLDKIPMNIDEAIKHHENRIRSFTKKDICTSYEVLDKFLYFIPRMVHEMEMPMTGDIMMDIKSSCRATLHLYKLFGEYMLKLFNVLWTYKYKNKRGTEYTFIFGDLYHYCTLAISIGYYIATSNTFDVWYILSENVFLQNVYKRYIIGGRTLQEL